jgi:hypothetical protein
MAMMVMTMAARAAASSDAGGHSPLRHPGRARGAQRQTTAASVPAEFVELTAVATTNEKELLLGGGPAEVRDCMGYAEAYNPLVDELEALARFVRYSVAAARHEAASHPGMSRCHSDQGI